MPAVGATIRDFKLATRLAGFELNDESLATA
jgi:hypothetical protein